VNNWKVIFATVVIFGAGVITGGLLVNYAHNSRPKTVRKPVTEVRVPVTNLVVHATDTGKQRTPEILSKQFLQRLEEELQLTPEQHDAIQKSISEGQNQMRKVMQDSRLQIRALLTPDQQKQFDVLIKHQSRKTLSNTNAPVVLMSTTNSSVTNAP
jgi:Spy/CpxP family protein refolding chaperone